MKKTESPSFSGRAVLRTITWSLRESKCTVIMCGLPAQRMRRSPMMVSLQARDSSLVTAFQALHWALNASATRFQTLLAMVWAAWRFRASSSSWTCSVNWTARNSCAARLVSSLLMGRHTLRGMVRPIVAGGVYGVSRVGLKMLEEERQAMARGNLYRAGTQSEACAAGV